jgi:formamidopyrimidine-DNA glycosylase
MPELPEVETTLRGIKPHILARPIIGVTIRNPRLRWPIDTELPTLLVGQQFLSVQRRGKYLLLQTRNGYLIIHLGMSGSLRITNRNTVYDKHDHFEIIFSDNGCLRLKDPRRFGAVIWAECQTEHKINQHKLLKHLGPEPLSDNFNSEYLFKASRKKKVTVKQLIMDSKIVVGVGNIYASEALFLAGIRPAIAAGRLSKKNCLELTLAIKKVLNHAIREGGTTLKDFTQSNGNPGYFKQHLNVYGRNAQPCYHCNTLIKNKIIAQRNSYYCPICQK